MNDDLYTGQGAESRIGRAVGEEPGRVGSGCLSNSPMLSTVSLIITWEDPQKCQELDPTVSSFNKMKSGHLKFCHFLAKHGC